ncbi:cobalamin biosynthesis protein CobW [Salaquimonas pukyongi]|uniref:cobalamin biosynthesis protein CobW n=1 Tax=Salaquimonas pukyongi TaxID=2712698 RepID=UPI00096BA1EE|nr:cobalamin biosynthesis protein CobW [Salaquimonas pukyongi]
MSIADSQKIPATVITGFLGAGKTTLIRNLLATANGKRIALIINEFGDLGVDGEVLKGCGEETCSEDDIVELTNGCICCTVADDFIPTMTALLERDRKPDHIVIETSGLALPQPLVSAFNWPEIREQVTVDGVVTVVDSRAVADGRFASDIDKVNAQRAEDEALDHESPLEELFEDQITCADMIILNKADLVEADALDRLQGEVKDGIKRAVKVVRASNGSLPASVLLGLGSGTESDIHNRKSQHELEHDAFHAEHGEGAGHDHHHDHDDFESFVTSLPPVASHTGVAAALAPLIEAHDVLRLKGFLAIEGKPMRLVVQAVGNRIDTYFDREWREGEVREGRLVVIGFEGLDQQAIGEAVKAALT